MLNKSREMSNQQFSCVPDIVLILLLVNKLKTTMRFRVEKTMNSKQMFKDQRASLNIKK